MLQQEELLQRGLTTLPSRKHAASITRVFARLSRTCCGGKKKHNNKSKNYRIDALEMEKKEKNRRHRDAEKKRKNTNRPQQRQHRRLGGAETAPRCAPPATAHPCHELVSRTRVTHRVAPHCARLQLSLGEGSVSRTRLTNSDHSSRCPALRTPAAESRVKGLGFRVWG